MLERREKNVRTIFHGRHFPDIPFGDIAIECSIKHCTNRPTATEKSPRIKERALKY